MISLTHRKTEFVKRNIYFRSPKNYADLAFEHLKLEKALMGQLLIPYSDMQAAVLNKHIAKKQEPKIQKCYFWTDSTIVPQ